MILILPLSKQLERAFKIFHPNWQSLKILSLSGHEGFLELLAQRRSTPDGKQNICAALLRILRRAGGENGYLARLKKSISIYTGDSIFKGHRSDPPFIERLVNINSHPDELLLE